MSLQTLAGYEFGPFRLEPGERRLLQHGKPVPLTPKILDTLLILVENHGQLVKKTDFMRLLWPNTFVEEIALAGNISDLRKALGEGTDGQKYIQTVPKSGYRFVAQVTLVDTSLPAQVASASNTRRLIRHRALLAAGGTLALFAFGSAVWLWHRPPTPVPIRSLAVLPFRSLQPNGGDAILQFGLADALISRLSNSQINVRPIGSVLRYADAASDPIRAGRELKVDAVLEGNIHSQPGAVRVTVRLLKVTDGSAIWTGSFDQPASQPFKIEDAVASEVVEALALRFPGNQKRMLAARHTTENAEAHQLYMKGRFFWGRRSQDGFRKAIGCFEQAIQNDPNYAEAYAGLADSLNLLGGYSYVAQKEVIERSRAAVAKALQLDPKLGEAHTTLALIHENYDWDWPATEREYKLAIQLNPNYATAHSWYGEFLTYMGRFEESFSEMQRALQLDPVSISINNDACFVYYFSRQYDKAIEQCTRVLEMEPRFVRARDRLAVTLVRKRMYVEALAAAQSMGTDENSSDDISLLGLAYAAMGDRTQARKYQALLNSLADRGGRVLPLDRVGIPLELGSKGEALHWLEKTYENHDVGLIILSTDAAFDRLRGERRFQALMKKMNFSP